MAWYSDITEEQEKELDSVIKNKKCPKCGSKRITISKGVEIEVEENLSTGKILSRRNIGDVIHWSYICRKCNWHSITCTE